MRSGVVLASLVLSSCSLPSATASESLVRDCRVAIAMSDGTALPAGLRLAVFEHERRVYQGKVPTTGIAEVAQIAPGDYRMQVGTRSLDFVASGSFHVDSAQPCSASLTLAGHTDSARKMVEDEVDVEDLRLPQEVRSRYQAALSDFQQGDLEKSRQGFLRVAALAPRMARAQNVLGVIATQQDKPNDAEMYFEKALELDPRSKSALMNLAKLSLAQRRYDVALQLLDRYRDGGRDIADVHGIKADIYLRTGHLEATIQEAEATHALPHANWAGVHLFAAAALEALQRQEDAVREYEVYLAEARDGRKRQFAMDKIDELGRTVRQSALPANAFAPKP